MKGSTIRRWLYCASFFVALDLRGAPCFPSNCSAASGSSRNSPPIRNPRIFRCAKNGFFLIEGAAPRFRGLFMRA